MRTVLVILALLGLALTLVGSVRTRIFGFVLMLLAVANIPHA